MGKLNDHGLCSDCTHKLKNFRCSSCKVKVKEMINTPNLKQDYEKIKNSIQAMQKQLAETTKSVETCLTNALSVISRINSQIADTQNLVFLKLYLLIILTRKK